jgi:hypothetical protein
MLFEVIIMDFHLVFQHSWDLWPKSTTAVASHSVTVNINVSYLITSPTPHGVIKSSIIYPFIRSTFRNICDHIHHMNNNAYEKYFHNFALVSQE